MWSYMCLIAPGLHIRKGFLLMDATPPFAQTCLATRQQNASVGTAVDKLYISANDLLHECTDLIDGLARQGLGNGRLLKFAYGDS